MKKGLLVLSVLWFSLIGYGCLMPAQMLSGASFLNISDKLIHFLLFFGLTVLTALTSGFYWKSTQKALWFAGLFGIIWGGIIELLQGYLPIMRSADIIDWFYDFFGTVIALLLVQVLHKFRLWNPKDGTLFFRKF